MLCVTAGAAFDYFIFLFYAPSFVLVVPPVLPGAIIKHQNDGHKSLSWLLLFYNLRGFSFQFASLEENETRTSSFATFAVFLFTHQIKLDEETCTLGVEFCLCWKKVIINICFRWIREKCAQKARTNLHFVFLAAAAVGGESSDYSKKALLLYHLHDGKKFYFSLCRALLITFFLFSKWIFHEPGGNIA